jgi:hypothetical protein
MWSAHGDPAGINLDILLSDGREAKLSGEEAIVDAPGRNLNDIRVYSYPLGRPEVYKLASQLSHDWNIDGAKDLAEWRDRVTEVSPRSITDPEAGNCDMVQHTEGVPRYKVSIRSAGPPKTTYVVIWEVFFYADK